MSLTSTLLRHEARIQVRSLRFRVVALLYLGMTSIAPVLTFLRREETSGRIGPATYPEETMALLPAATLVLAFLLSLDGLTRERREGAWSTLSMAPVSDLGWVLRRFTALWGVVGLLGAVPLALGAGLALAGGGILDPWSFVLPWALHVLPVAALGVAVGLALGAVGDGSVPGIGLAILLLSFGGTAVAETVGRWGIGHGLSARWLGWYLFDHHLDRVLQAGELGHPERGGMPFAASEAPSDIGPTVLQHVPYLIPCLALAALALVVGSRFLRRARPDHSPWKVGPNHPLRSFVALAGRLRDRYAPDLRQSPRDLWTAAVLVLGALVLYGALSHRGLEYRRLGRERYAVERSPDLAPMPASVVPGAWEVEGALERRTLDLAVRSEMKNLGPEPVSRMTFTLDPGLEVVELDARGGAAIERKWERLVVTVNRPLPPGESVQLRFHLRGRPTTVHFHLSGHQSFQRAFGHHARHGGMAFELSPSWTEPLVSPRWTSLGAESLFPRPRYTSWELVPGYGRRSGDLVPGEVIDPPLDLSLRLAARSGGIDLVDSCGGRLVDGILESACSTPVGDYALVGGERRRVDGSPTFLVFPAHADTVEALRRGLSLAGASIGNAWPGAPRPEELTVVEMPFRDPGPFGWQSRLWFSFSDDSMDHRIEVRNRLLVLGEGSFAMREPVPPDALAAAVLGSWLSRRRAPAPEGALLQRWFFETLARRRVRPGETGGAVLPANRAGASLYALDLFALDYPAPHASRRLEALLAALEGRVGPAVLRSAVEGYLSEPGAGNLEELFAILGRQSGDEDWVAGFFEDFVRGEAVPQLALADVTFHREEGLWTARGRVVNEGDGSPTCPVTLTTEISPVTSEIRIPSGGSASFVVSSPYRPQAVFLDPEETCLRYRPLSPPERVDFEAAPDA